MHMDSKDRTRNAVAEAPKVFRDGLVIDGLMVAPPSGRIVANLLGAGLTGCNWTVASHSDDTLAAINKLIPFYWLLEQHADKALMVESGADLDRAKREGKFGIVLGFQGASPLGRNVHLIRVFYRLGVRIIQLSYNEGNAFCAGCTEPSDSGLTSLGVQAVHEMNRIGVVIDLSHVGRRSSLQAIDLSTAPVIFSHSNPLALQANPRNISDEQMQACASKGGVIGLSTFSAFVGDTLKGKHPKLEDYFRQMDYALELVGPDHVAIGTDIFTDPTDGVWWNANTGRLYREVSQGMTDATHNVAGFMYHSDFPAVAQAMLDHKYSAEIVGKIMGGNWRRVYGQVWGK